jgi:hypothetical protein
MLSVLKRKTVALETFRAYISGCLPSSHDHHGSQIVNLFRAVRKLLHRFIELRDDLLRSKVRASRADLVSLVSPNCSPFASSHSKKPSVASTTTSPGSISRMTGALEFNSGNRPSGIACAPNSSKVSRAEWYTNRGPCPAESSSTLPHRPNIPQPRRSRSCWLGDLLRSNG